MAPITKRSKWLSRRGAVLIISMIFVLIFSIPRTKVEDQLGEYKKAGREEGEYYPARIVPPSIILYDWQ